MKKYFEITKRLWKLLKPFHKYFYLQLFLILITQAVSTFTTFTISKIIDSTVSKHWNILTYFLVLYFTLLIIKNISSAIQGRQEIKYSMGAIRTHIQEYSLHKILRLNASQHIEDHSAIKQQVIDRGEDSLINIIETLLLSILPIALSFTFSIIAVSHYSKFIGIYSISFIIIVIVATIKFTEYFRPMMRKNIDNWDKQRKIRVEAFEHLRIIKLFGMETLYVYKYSSFLRSYLSKHNNHSLPQSDYYRT